MIVINVKQRTDAWLRWRKTGLSASDASTILEVNPYKTPWRLWGEKTGRVLPNDVSRVPSVINGVLLEDRGRQTAEILLGDDCLFPVCGQSDQNPLVLSSFDGTTELDIPVEIKCPAESTYAEVVNLGRSSPSYALHYPQLQQQIYVADVDHGWLLFYNPLDNGDHRIFKVMRDDDLIEILLSKIETFWDYVENDKQYPMNPKLDIYVPTDDQTEEWIYQADKYRLFNQQIKKYEENIKLQKQKRNKHQKELQNMMGDFCKAEFAGVALTRFNQQGKINYSKLIAENLDVSDETLEQYRGDDSERCRVTVTNQAMPRNVVDINIKEKLSDVDDGDVQSLYF